MSFIKKEYKKFSKKSYEYCILGCDIGSTNTNIGVFGVKNSKPNLLLSFHFKTQELRSLYYAINEIIEYLQEDYRIKITKACFGIAGVISHNRDKAKITNAKLSISKKQLLNKTKLEKIFLINDFEAVGYGINLLTKDDVIVIKNAQKVSKAPILLIGAGTGLGKAILVYDEHNNAYIPLPSEAGHTDFPAQNKQELELVNFIKKHRKIKESMSYEQLLSGRGISNIYLFLRKTKKFKETCYTKKIDETNSPPELISKYRRVDATCKATFEIFKLVYARFARNFALDSLSWGGAYIAGGIAPKNRDIFDNKFVKTFLQSYKLSDVLKKVPIYLVLNYNVGLLGAGFAGVLFL